MSLSGPCPRANILGVYVSAINLDQTVKRIDEWVYTRTANYVCVTPAHGIMECRDDSELRKIFNASGMTTPDGMSVVWILKLKGYRHVSRVYGPDLMQAVCKVSAEKEHYRHYFYGGAPGVPEQLADSLQTLYPGLCVSGVYSPPFRSLTPEEDRAVIDRINEANPDIVWVGISTPKQERWMASHLGKISAPVMIGVGAAFDFLSGNTPQAPRWMQRSGLEWLFRLGTEPRRLWRRYAQYPLFGLLLVAQALGIVDYSVSEK